MTPRFKSVVLDVDMTLSGVEGIDWLAAHRNEALRAFVTQRTADAMAGTVPLDAVYGERLDSVAPTLAELQTLGLAYRTKLAPQAREAVRSLLDAGVRVVLVSGGLRIAVLALADALGIPESDVHAVQTIHNERGLYDGFDHRSPLATQEGKPTIVRTLGLPALVLAVGDGSTDLAIRVAGAADAFAAYTGFVRRDAVVAGADHVIASFPDLISLVLP
ncbi:MAG: HAD-IB family phosphatase [Gemmatimonadetes bacterium]|nr:HAD-IB family phosphatase [Gemmatimonadota bacterium]MBI3568769.1 HAD-IB family phosphatase [Gemmatimonadota bacterium]